MKRANIVSWYASCFASFQAAFCSLRLKEEVKKGAYQPTRLLPATGLALEQTLMKRTSFRCRANRSSVPWIWDGPLEGSITHPDQPNVQSISPYPLNDSVRYRLRRCRLLADSTNAGDPHTSRCCCDLADRRPGCGVYSPSIPDVLFRVSTILCLMDAGTPQHCRRVFIHHGSGGTDLEIEASNRLKSDKEFSQTSIPLRLACYTHWLINLTPCGTSL